MLSDMYKKWDECIRCKSKDLIFGHRSFKDDKSIKIEIECNKCKKIYFKVLNERDYKKLQSKEATTKAK